MTIKELRKLIKGLPSNIKVVIGIGDSLEDICSGNAGVTCVEYNDTKEKDYLLVLPECECKLQGCDITANGLNVQPELN